MFPSNSRFFKLPRKLHERWKPVYPDRFFSALHIEGIRFISDLPLGTKISIWEMLCDHIDDLKFLFWSGTPCQSQVICTDPQNLASLFKLMVMSRSSVSYGACFLDPKITVIPVYFPLMTTVFFRRPITFFNFLIADHDVVSNRSCIQDLIQGCISIIQTVYILATAAALERRISIRKY